MSISQSDRAEESVREALREVIVHAQGLAAAASLARLGRDDLRIERIKALTEIVQPLQRSLFTLAAHVEGRK